MCVEGGLWRKWRNLKSFLTCLSRLNWQQAFSGLWLCVFYSYGGHGVVLFYSMLKSLAVDFAQWEMTIRHRQGPSLYGLCPVNRSTFVMGNSAKKHNSMINLPVRGNPIFLLHVIQHHKQANTDLQLNSLRNKYQAISTSDGEWQTVHLASLFYWESIR